MASNSGKLKESVSFEFCSSIIVKMNTAPFQTTNWVSFICRGVSDYLSSRLASLSEDLWQFLRSLIDYVFINLQEDVQYIAADLNLYPNPLNKILSKAEGKAKSPSPEKSTGDILRKLSAAPMMPTDGQNSSKMDSNGDEIIALDLNKYDSPMDDLGKK